MRDHAVRGHAVLQGVPGSDGSGLRESRGYIPGVSPGSEWGQAPRQSIASECARRGKDNVVSGCIELLAGRECDPALVFALGGPSAPGVLDGGPGSVSWYWVRVWAARGLLWAWDDVALPAIVAAMADDAWRVREMAAKAVARHGLGDALAAVAQLQDDPVPRVRAAASRALVALTSADA